MIRFPGVLLSTALSFCCAVGRASEHLLAVVLGILEQLDLSDQDRLLLEDVQYPVPL